MAKKDTETAATLTREPPRAGRGRPRSFDRDQALDQAMRVFWEKGFVATSLSDLTTAMGIAPPSLYAAFGSKEGLYSEALDRYDTRVRTLLGGLFEGDTPLREQIEGSLHLSARIEDTSQPQGCMVMMACEQRDELSCELGERLVDRRDLGMRLLRQRLDRAVAAGELSADVDVGGLTDFLTTVQRGLGVSAKTGVSAAELEASIAVAMKAWDALTR